MTTPQELLDLLEAGKDGARGGLDRWVSRATREDRPTSRRSDALGELAAIIDQAERGDVEGLSHAPTPRELLAQLKQATPQDERPSDELKQLRMVGRSDALLDLDSIIYREEHPTTPEEHSGHRPADGGHRSPRGRIPADDCAVAPIYERSRERSRKMSAAWRAAGSPKRVEAFYARDGVTYHVRRADGSYELATDEAVQAWHAWCRERQRLRGEWMTPTA